MTIMAQGTTPPPPPPYTASPKVDPPPAPTPKVVTKIGISVVSPTVITRNGDHSALQIRFLPCGIFSLSERIFGKNDDCPSVDDDVKVLEWVNSPHFAISAV